VRVGLWLWVQVASELGLLDLFNYLGCVERLALFEALHEEQPDADGQRQQQRDEQREPLEEAQQRAGRLGSDGFGEVVSVVFVVPREVEAFHWRTLCSDEGHCGAAAVELDVEVSEEDASEDDPASEVVEGETVLVFVLQREVVSGEEGDDCCGLEGEVEVREGLEPVFRRGELLAFEVSDALVGLREDEALDASALAVYFLLAQLGDFLVDGTGEARLLDDEVRRVEERGARVEEDALFLVEFGLGAADAELVDLSESRLRRSTEA